MPENLWIVPTGMVPKNGFHMVATKALGFSDDTVLTRTPYPTASLSTHVEGCITGVNADLFPGDILLLSINAKLAESESGDFRCLLETLKEIRSPKLVPIIDALVREGTALALGDRSIDRNSLSYEDYFGVQIRLPVADDLFEDTLKPVRSNIVSLLIGAPNADMLNSEVIDRVEETSAELNTKAFAEKMLLNRQGLLYLRSRSPYRGPHPNRFSRARDLAKLAIYSRSFLRDAHHFSMFHPRLSQFLFQRVRQWVEYPQLVFDASVSQTLAWTAFVEEFLLADRLEAWTKLSESKIDLPARTMAQIHGEWWTADVLSELLDDDAFPG